MRADDDLDAELDLRHRAFGPIDMANRAYWREEMLGCIAADRQFGAWDGGHLIGAARYHDMRQYWHGRPVRMAGVGGVKVAPEARGRGVGRAMMTELLSAMAKRGFALSVLYPATAQLYRALGWELAGGHYLAQVPGRSLGSLLPPDAEIPAPPADPAEPASAAPRADAAAPPPAAALADAAAAAVSTSVRRAGPDDAEEVIAVMAAVHASARDCGPATRDLVSVRRWLAEPGLFGYLAPDGFLRYGWHAGGDKEIMIRVLVAGSEPTARALWGIVASHASVTKVVHVTLGPSDPVGWLISEPDVSLRRHKHWMLRVLDPVAAISTRGFPAAARADVRLSLADPDLPGNAGRYHLSVRDGEGTLLPGPTGRTAGSPSCAPVAMGPRGFAAMYAGVPVATLRAAGLAAGGDGRADAALDTVFGAQPFLLDYF